MAMTVRILVLMLVLTACGSDAIDSESTDSPPPSTWPEPVPALAVEIIGDLDGADLDVVNWAVGRFDAAGLRLPPRIAFEFDESGRECDGCVGICHVERTPPGVTVCAPAGTTAHLELGRRIAVLHELAHLWHRACGDGLAWPDASDIVGGCLDGDARWEDRMHERVAIVVSWGLLDQLRRPVRTDAPCSALFAQFVELTGRPPLEPLEDVCRPSASFTEGNDRMRHSDTV